MMSQLKLNVKLKKCEDGGTLLNFCLSNNTDEFIGFDKFCMSFMFPFREDAFVNAALLKNVGSYIELAIKNSDKIEVVYSKADKVAAFYINVKDENERNIGEISSRKLNCFPLPQKIEHLHMTADLSRGFILDIEQEFLTLFENAVETERDFASDVTIFRQSDDGTPLKISMDDLIVKEGYKLSITADRVEIAAADVGGLHNALMSLWQIAALNPHDVSCVEIEDAPRFEWRGQHLDVARQFYSMDEVKRFLNHMALYKMNKFHWHLVDDEAWRVEIKALPVLTKKIAFRGHDQLMEPGFGSTCEADGGFYTQDDMREIVAYAAKRNIEVIPEIDVPGHCYALLKAIPDLVEKEDLSDYKSVQGYHNNCLNPGLPQTYEFMDTVFKEVADIFPSDFIHIGADERPKGSWERSPKIAELMAANGYNSTEQVQTHFLKKVQNIAKKYGKKTGAWEEASEQGDIDKHGYVVSWKGVEAGINAAERGYNMVMAPAQFCYFDIAQSEHFDEPGLTWTGARVSMETTYSYNPIPDDIAPELKSNFKGIQGCLWSENLYDKTIVDHLMFPRLIALSEICWTEIERQNYDNFKYDLKKYHQNMLDGMKINYRRRDFA
ncbi:MAG: beta-N-acetylhexosaminidase [Rhizobiales bacterium]|nr:beta-N-acetylhexosaminidase [Hyphomicrobiales bacterium]